jgi:hypothetical protein
MRASFLSPLRGFVIARLLPRACALGYILFAATRLCLVGIDASAELE